jgi:uncharacterized protein GlcG (DUF336 family)
MNRSIHVAGYLLALTVAAGCDRANIGAARGETTKGAPQNSNTNQGASAKGSCDDLPKEDDLKRLLKDAPGKGEAGGLAGGRFEWAAVVNREGALCAVVTSTDDVTAPWPGSRAIAIAKAFTANAFSSDTTPLSTARLYTLSQPGHSLWGIAAGNPFNPDCLAKPSQAADTGKVCGGTIAFGGGVPLYRGQRRVGGLGASGDTACADHEIAKRMREETNMNPPKGAAADDIVFPKLDEPSIYAHPLCPNTWRNGKKLGDEAPNPS